MVLNSFLKTTDLLELGGSFSAFARVHVCNDSADRDGSDLEALQHFAEIQSLIVGAWTAYSSLKAKQRNYERLIAISALPKVEIEIN